MTQETDLHIDVGIMKKKLLQSSTEKTVI